MKKNKKNIAFVNETVENSAMKAGVINKTKVWRKPFLIELETNQTAGPPGLLSSDGPNAPRS